MCGGSERERLALCIFLRCETIVLRLPRSHSLDPVCVDKVGNEESRQQEKVKGNREKDRQEHIRIWKGREIGLRTVQRGNTNPSMLTQHNNLNPSPYAKPPFFSHQEQ